MSTSDPLVRHPPLRLTLAYAASRALPLVGAHLIAGRIFPWALAQRLRPQARRRALTGTEITVDASDEYGYFFALRGCYDWKLWAVAHAVCRAGDTIVEVGANIGTETVGFADIVGPGGRVIAFEPLPANLAILRANTRLTPQVEIVDAAASDAVGEVSFVVPEGSNSGVGHLWGADGEESADSHAVRVRTVRLDDTLRDTAPRLLMMDAEGSEPAVLRGAATVVETHHPVIVTEAHHHRDDLSQWLRDRGYLLRSIERTGLRPIRTAEDALQWNWIAVHESDPRTLRRVDRTIKLCGFAPQIPGLHPLVRHVQARAP
jgi:FkbM family methyltransferase